MRAMRAVKSGRLLRIAGRAVGVVLARKLAPATLDGGRWSRYGRTSRTCVRVAAESAVSAGINRSAR